jgi:hypothetical protein
MRRIGFIVVCLVLSAGCGAYGRRAVRTAALDHDCPEDQIQLVDRQGVTAVLNVCGTRRVYRDIGGAEAVVWTDVTTTAN